MHCDFVPTSFTPSFTKPSLTPIATSPVDMVTLFSIQTMSTVFRTSSPILVVLTFCKVSIYHLTLSNVNLIHTIFLCDWSTNDIWNILYSQSQNLKLYFYIFFLEISKLEFFENRFIYYSWKNVAYFTLPALHIVIIFNKYFWHQRIIWYL